MKVKRIENIEKNVFGLNMSIADDLLWKITKKERLDIYNIMCWVLYRDIENNWEISTFNGEKYNLIDSLERWIELYHIDRNFKWQNNKWSFIISLDDRKLFCKIYEKEKEYNIYKDVWREFNWMCRMKSHGYKVIEPIMYYCDNTKSYSLIVYPFMEEFKNGADCLVDKNFPKKKIQELKEICNKAYQEMNPLWIEDIKYLNMYYNPKDEEFYFFDCIDTR